MKNRLSVPSRFGQKTPDEEALSGPGMEDHQPWWHQAGEGPLKGPAMASKTWWAGVSSRTGAQVVSVGIDPKSRKKDGA